eukprot:10053331-Alexandrium_andersonii.AAC.1
MVACWGCRTPHWMNPCIPPPFQRFHGAHTRPTCNAHAVPTAWLQQHCKEEPRRTYPADAHDWLLAAVAASPKLLAHPSCTPTNGSATRLPYPVSKLSLSLSF